MTQFITIKMFLIILLHVSRWHQNWKSVFLSMAPASNGGCPSGVQSAQSVATLPSEQVKCSVYALPVYNWYTVLLIYSWPSLPECPVPVPPRPNPPGECIYQHGTMCPGQVSCTFGGSLLSSMIWNCIADCTTWSDICWGWDCGTLYQEEVANSYPPPPCPMPPFPIKYLPKPGLCKYDINVSRCNFITDRKWKINCVHKNYMRWYTQQLIHVKQQSALTTLSVTRA